MIFSKGYPTLIPSRWCISIWSGWWNSTWRWWWNSAYHLQFAFTDKNAGDGNTCGNYNVSYADKSTGTSNPKALAIASLASKVYDGTIAATADATQGVLIGAIGGDDVEADTSGAQAEGTVLIYQKQVSITGFAHGDKVYDATTNASVDATKATCWIAGDTVTASATEIFDNKNVGIDKTVNLSSSYTGADVINYTITDQGLPPMRK